jgi:hypothetical protein
VRWGYAPNPKEDSTFLFLFFFQTAVISFIMKSCIHIQPVKFYSEKHNRRELDLDYVRKDLIGQNSSFEKNSIAKILKEVQNLYEEKVGQKMQKSATPIREGVVLISENHTIEELKKLSNLIEEKYKIEIFQIHIHKDEGHFKNGEWFPNYHAHLLMRWQDKETGKSVKLNKENMSEMQSLIAENLGMERGKSSELAHLTPLQFKRQSVEQDLKNLSEEFSVQVRKVEDGRKTLKRIFLSPTRHEDLKVSREIAGLIKLPNHEATNARYQQVLDFTLALNAELETKLAETRARLARLETKLAQLEKQTTALKTELTQTQNRANDLAKWERKFSPMQTYLATNGLQFDLTPDGQISFTPRPKNPVPQQTQKSTQTQPEIQSEIQPKNSQWGGMKKR